MKLNSNELYVIYNINGNTNFDDIYTEKEHAHHIYNKMITEFKNSLKYNITDEDFNRIYNPYSVLTLQEAIEKHGDYIEELYSHQNEAY